MVNLMANGVRDYKNVTENSLLRIVDDHYDAISIMSQYPECFEAYKSLIQKKRLTSKGGGLTADNSQQNGMMLDGIRDTSK
jgi:hypothetical protein